MGLFSTLFSSKSKILPPVVTTNGAGSRPPSRPETQRVVATSGTPAGKPASGIIPRPVASAASLQMPQPVLPRSLTQRLRPTPALPQIRTSELPGIGSVGGLANEVTLTLADILPQVPKDLINAEAPIDLSRALCFPTALISAELARGRPAVPLALVAQQCPDIFISPESINGDEMVRLPLQKLLQEIGSLKRASVDIVSRALPAPHRSVSPSGGKKEPLRSWLNPDNAVATNGSSTTDQPIRAVEAVESAQPIDEESRTSGGELAATSEAFEAEVIDIIPRDTIEVTSEADLEAAEDIADLPSSAAAELISEAVPSVESIDASTPFEAGTAQDDDSRPVAVETSAGATEQVREDEPSSDGPPAQFKLLIPPVSPSPVSREVFETQPIGGEVLNPEPPVEANHSTSRRVESTESKAVRSEARLALNPSKADGVPALPRFPIRPPFAARKIAGQTGVIAVPTRIPPASPMFQGRRDRQGAPSLARVSSTTPQLFGSNPLDRYFSAKVPPPVNWSTPGTLLGLNGEVTFSQLAEAIALLPGIEACLLVAAPHLAAAGNWPASMGVDNSLAFARRLADALKRTERGMFSQRRIVTNVGELLFFGIDGLYICVATRPGELIAGTGERLHVVTKAMAHARQAVRKQSEV